MTKCFFTISITELWRSMQHFDTLVNFPETHFNDCVIFSKPTKQINLNYSSLDFSSLFLSNHIHICAPAHPRTAAWLIHMLCEWPGSRRSSEPTECQLSLVVPSCSRGTRPALLSEGVSFGPKRKSGLYSGVESVYVFTCESGFNGENSNTQIGGSARVSVSTLVKVVLSEPRLKQKRPQPLGFVLTHQTDL